MEKKTDPASGKVYIGEYNPYAPPTDPSFRAAEKRRFTLLMLLILGTVIGLISWAVC